MTATEALVLVLGRVGAEEKRSLRRERWLSEPRVWHRIQYQIEKDLAQDQKMRDATEVAAAEAQRSGQKVAAAEGQKVAAAEKQDHDSEGAYSYLKIAAAEGQRVAAAEGQGHQSPQ